MDHHKLLAFITNSKLLTEDESSTVDRLRCQQKYSHTHSDPYMPNEALQLLKSLHTNNLHVISVAGKYRTGKSYILNRVLLNQNQGFNVGHTINACTKGLWMWP